MTERSTAVVDSQPDDSGSIDAFEAAVEPFGEPCPKCGVPANDLPFCEHDGHILHRPFTIADRYVLGELIGLGTTAIVFGGHDKQLGRAIALKILRPRLAVQPGEATRFLGGARLGSQLEHENIVVVHDSGTDPTLGLVYLVMELLIGGTAAPLRGLTWQRTVGIMVQVCRALATAHARGIVHRDLGLRNITLTARSGRADVVKLCDFALARPTQGDERAKATGSSLRSPAYMAPEQIRGDEDQDHRVDLYALGVIGYELLTGELPHEAPTAIAMIARKLTAPAIPLAERNPDLDLPRKLEALIMRCLETEPSARPQSAAELEIELLALGAPDPARPFAKVDLVGQLVGHHRIIQRLDQGGMGEIYLVEHEVIKTRAALKVLLPELASNADAVERFVQEAKASSGIKSSRIARCYDLGFLPDKRAYVLMDLVEGESVGAMLKRGPLPLADVKVIVQQTTEALTAAHAHELVHRDIKPEHIMVRRVDGAIQVTILDFGIAKVFTDDTSRTQVGVFMGTPLYCAPEQVLGLAVSPATDIYALGATTYEMLTGRSPFSGEAGHVLAIKTTRDPVAIAELRPTLPPEVADTVTRMLAREPAARPRSMTAVALEVKAWPDHEVAAAAPVVAAKPIESVPVTVPVTVPAGRRWMLPAACVAVAGIVLAVILWPASDPAPVAAPQPAIEVAPAPAVEVAPAPAVEVTPASAVEVAPAPPAAAAPPAGVASTPAPGRVDKQRPRKDRPRKGDAKPGTRKPAGGSADVMIVDPFK